MEKNFVLYNLLLLIVILFSHLRGMEIDDDSNLMQKAADSLMIHHYNLINDIQDTIKNVSDYSLFIKEDEENLIAKLTKIKNEATYFYYKYQPVKSEANLFLLTGIIYRFETAYREFLIELNLFESKIKLKDLKLQ